MTIWLGFVLIRVNNVDYMFHACRLDEFFTLYVHHGGYFDENPKKYVGREAELVDDCNPDKWSKVEIEAIYKDFGIYTCE